MQFFKKTDNLTELAKKAINGDLEAFSDIYTLTFEKVYKFIFFRVNHKETAEDLSEEVFIKAFSKITSLKNPDIILGWLYQISRNSVIDYYRQKKITVALEDIENTLEYDSNIIDRSNLHFDQIQILKLLKILSSQEQLIIKMRFLEELNIKEISEILNLTQVNVRVIQHRALNKLLKNNQNEPR